MRPSPASVAQYKADQAKAAPKELTVTYGQLEILARVLNGITVSAAANRGLESVREQISSHLNSAYQAPCQDGDDT